MLKYSERASLARQIRLQPLIKPRHRMRGKLEPIPNRLDERRGRQHGMPELLGRVLQPRHLVDGAADHREVDPLVGADIRLS